MDLLAIQRTADFFTAIAIIFLTTITFYMYSIVKKTEARMERLVRKIALDKEEEQEKKTKAKKK